MLESGSTISGHTLACAACGHRFANDSTLYPDPNQGDTFFCKNCFASKFSKGDCGKCRKAVLGDLPFVTTGDRLFHNVSVDLSADKITSLDVSAEMRRMPLVRTKRGHRSNDSR